MTKYYLFYDFSRYDMFQGNLLAEGRKDLKELNHLQTCFL